MKTQCSQKLKKEKKKKSLQENLLHKYAIFAIIYSCFFINLPAFWNENFPLYHIPVFSIIYLFLTCGFHLISEYLADFLLGKLN